MFTRRRRIHGGRPPANIRLRHTIPTILGKVSWKRSTGRRVGKLRRMTDLQVDRALGLSGSFTVGVIDRQSPADSQALRDRSW